MQLRGYQTELVDLCSQAVKDGYKKFIAVSPTRSGKTVIFSHMADKIQSANLPVWILTHRDPIFQQTKDKIENFGMKAGKLKPNKKISKNLVQVGMIKTVFNILKKQEKKQKKYNSKKIQIINPPAYIIIDEAHHSTSPTWKYVINYFPNTIVIGFTATPERLDGAGMKQAGYQKLILGKTTEWMIDNYWLSKPRFLRPPSPLDKESIKIFNGDYDKKAQTEIMTRNIVCGKVVRDYRKYFNGKPVIVFCCTIVHAEKMKIAYEADGWNPVIISSKKTKTQRREAIEGFTNGKYHQLISINVVSEGFDVPFCFGVQLLKKTLSLAGFLQMAARGLTPIYAKGFDLENKNERRKALELGKPISIILDHGGNYWIHGNITKEHHWKIDTKKRNNKKKIIIKKIICPKCSLEYEPRTKKCICGFNFDIARNQKKDFEINELEEELVDVYHLEKTMAENLSKIIIKLKVNPKKRSAMLAILCSSMRDGESNIKQKITIMCQGLGYKKQQEDYITEYLKKQYPQKAELLE